MANNIIACRKSFTDTLLELARQDKDIVAVTTDARGSVTLGDFAKELPAQFVECGIAEQDAVGISAGSRVVCQDRTIVQSDSFGGKERNCSESYSVYSGGGQYNS